MDVVGFESENSNSRMFVHRSIKTYVLFKKMMLLYFK